MSTSDSNLDLYAMLVKQGRISQAHAARRRAKECPGARRTRRQGASRGLIAGRIGRYAHWVRRSLRVSGLLARGRRNARQIQVNRNTVRIAKLPSALEKFSILHLSDLHLDMAHDMSAMIAQKVREVRQESTPNIAVVTGDFRALVHGEWQPCIDYFSAVRAELPMPVYAVLGNHDCLAMVQALESQGITVLLNEHQVIQCEDAQLTLAGVDDPHYYECDDLAGALENAPKDAPVVLLSHTPELFAQAAQARVDLMLAGHTHGGQICLPGGLAVIVNADCPRAYCNGAWQHESLQGYTSAGTGSSVLDVRFNCPPEITLHELTQAEI